MISNLRQKVTLSAEKGFTLIELMIVIAVIGILAAIALPRFGSVKSTANQARAESEMKNIQTALEMYYSKHEAYPDTGEELQNIEGIDSSVITKYSGGGSNGSGYTPADDNGDGYQSYDWVYDNGEYEIEITSDGVFESTAN